MIIITSIFEQMFFCPESAQWVFIVTEKRENRYQKESLFAHNALMTVSGFNRPARLFARL